MAVAFDSAVESHTTGTTASASEPSFTWTHTPSSTIKGVQVIVFTSADSDYISSVTCNGRTMTQVDEANGSTGEPGRTTLFELEGVPSGQLTFVVNRTNNATNMYAVSVACTTAAGFVPTVYSARTKQTTAGTLDEISVDDGSPGTNSVRFGAITSGLSSIVDNPTTPGTNNLSRGASSTVMHNYDFGSRVVATVRETTAGQGARSVGFRATTSDDRYSIYWAVTEIATTALAGKAIATQGRGNGNPLNTPIRATLAGKARAVVARALATRFSFVEKAAPARATTARMTGALGSKQSLAGRGRVTMARAAAILGMAAVTASLAGEARATEARATGALTSHVALTGYARATQDRAKGILTSYAALAGYARATQDRATGILVTETGLAGYARATQDRGNGTLGTKQALAGYARATQPRGKGQTAPAVITALAGKGIASGARALALRINFVSWASPARATQDRGLGVATASVGPAVLAGKARATEARAKGVLASHVALIGKARASGSSHRGILQFAGGTTASLAGKARATQPRGRALRISFVAKAAPARATQLRAHSSLFTATGVTINKSRATQARSVANIDINIYAVWAAIATQPRARGTLSVTTAIPIQQIVGKARATQGRIVSDIDINLYVVDEARATQARAKGLLSTSSFNVVSLAGRAIATQSRARVDHIVLTQYVAEARATQSRLKGRTVYTIAPLVGKTRATQARTTVANISMVWYVAEARATQPRLRSDITLELILQPSKATQARARASARFAGTVLVNLAGKSRVTQARASGTLTVHVNTILVGNARATQSSTVSEITLGYREGPSRVTQPRSVNTSGFPNAVQFAGMARATQARTTSDILLGIRIFATRTTQARTISEATVRIPQGPSRVSGTRVFGLAVTTVPPIGICFPATYVCTFVPGESGVLVGTYVPVIEDVAVDNIIVPGLGCISTGNVTDLTPPVLEPSAVALAGHARAVQGRAAGVLSVLEPEAVLMGIARATQGLATGLLPSPGVPTLVASVPFVTAVGDTGLNLWTPDGSGVSAFEHKGDADAWRVEFSSTSNRVADEPDEHCVRMQPEFLAGTDFDFQVHSHRGAVSTFIVSGFSFAIADTVVADWNGFGYFKLALDGEFPVGVISYVDTDGVQEDLASGDTVTWTTDTGKDLRATRVGNTLTLYTRAIEADPWVSAVEYTLTGAEITAANSSGYYGIVGYCLLASGRVFTSLLALTIEVPS